MRHTLFTDEAILDFMSILQRSRKQFGIKTCEAYGALMEQAMIDLSEQPERLGVYPRFDIEHGVYFYHLKHSKKHVPKPFTRIHSPRHFMVFRLPSPQLIQIVRVLHESMEFESKIYPQV